MNSSEVSGSELPDDRIVFGLRHARDRAVGRRLVISRQADGWRIGYQLPHYAGTTWRASEDPDMAMVPVGWDIAEWIGEPLQELADAVAAAGAIRSRVLERVESGLESNALLPVVLDVAGPQIPLRRQQRDSVQQTVAPQVEPEACGHCGGTGDTADMVACRRCDGSGFEPDWD